MLEDEEEVVSGAEVVAGAAAVDEAEGALGWAEEGSLWSAGGVAGAPAVAADVAGELEASLVEEAPWSEGTSAADRSSGCFAAPEDAAGGDAGVATGGGVPEAVAGGACAMGAGTVGDEAGIGGGGGATSVTTGALASAFASAVADLDRCLAAGSP